MRKGRRNLLCILLICILTALLNERAKVLDGSRLNERIRDILLALSQEIPIRKIRDPSIIRNNGTRVIKTPERNLFQRAQILSIVRKIYVVHSSLQICDTGGDFGTSAAELHNSCLGEDGVGGRGRDECECEEIFDTIFETGEVPKGRDAAGCVGGEEAFGDCRGTFSDDGEVICWVKLVV